MVPGHQMGGGSGVVASEPGIRTPAARRFLGPTSAATPCPTLAPTNSSALVNVAERARKSVTEGSEGQQRRGNTQHQHEERDDQQKFHGVPPIPWLLDGNNPPSSIQCLRSDA